VFTKDEELNYRMSRMRNFGHAGYEKFDGVGINGKNSEYHAAMGLCNLTYIQDILESRKKQCLLYEELLKDAPAQRITIQEQADWNYAYYPVIFESEAETLKVKKALEENDIHPRRYFYPSLDTLEYVETEEVNISKDISKRILCLPVYFELKNTDIKFIINSIEV